MIYVTIKQKTDASQHHFQAQVTIEDILQHGGNYIPETTNTNRHPDYFKTITYLVEEQDNAYTKLLTKYPITAMRNKLIDLEQRYIHLLKEDMSDMYDTFYIPKHSGGMRRIDAPKPELMAALLNVKNTFQYDFYSLAHNAAHAYVAKRSSITAMQLHQKHESRWFLKLDLKDFFPSHNLEYTYNTLQHIFPYSALPQDTLKNLLKLGLLNDSLPQGTPLSPLLTNLLMIPIDQAITDVLRNEQEKYFVYTRYADDLLISCKYNFDWQAVQEKIKIVLRNYQTPFQLKTEKTHYGSASGRNWNLGIMLNKDNNLTIGHKQNQRFKAALFNFLKDLTNGKHWDKMDVQVLLGKISYYKAIEPDYVEHVIKTYSEKFNTDAMRVIKNALR